MRLLYERICRILAWIPVLWRDNDFAGDSLAPIVAFKLRRLAHVIEKYNTRTNWEKDARDIRACAEHLRRFQHPELNGAPPPHEPMRFESVPGSKYRRLVPPSKKTQRWGDHLRALEEYHWNAAWEMIQKKGRSWWD